MASTNMADLFLAAGAAFNSIANRAMELVDENVIKNSAPLTMEEADQMYGVQEKKGKAPKKPKKPRKNKKQTQAPNCEDTMPPVDDEPLDLSHPPTFKKFLNPAVKVVVEQMPIQTPMTVYPNGKEIIVFNGYHPPIPPTVPASVVQPTHELLGGDGSNEDNVPINENIVEGKPNPAGTKKQPLQFVTDHNAAQMVNNLTDANSKAIEFLKQIDTLVKAISDLTTVDEIVPVIDDLEVAETVEIPVIDDLEVAETVEIPVIDDLEVAETVEIPVIDDLKVTETVEIPVINDLEVAESVEMVTDNNQESDYSDEIDSHTDTEESELSDDDILEYQDIRAGAHLVVAETVEIETHVYQEIDIDQAETE